MLSKILPFILLGFLLTSPHAVAQQDTEIHWLTFQELQDSLAIKPKKVFIDFYTDWCLYCKKMDKVSFRDAQVVATMHKDYYAVKMNAESKDTIVFNGDTFINTQTGKQRNPMHEIPLLLASRPDVPFSLPAMVVLNENFQITDRYFEYMDKKKLLKALEAN